MFLIRMSLIFLNSICQKDMPHTANASRISCRIQYTPVRPGEMDVLGNSGKTMSYKGVVCLWIDTSPTSGLQDEEVRSCEACHANRAACAS